MRDLLFTRFCEEGEIPYDKLQFAVIISTYKGKLVLVKHKKRTTYEVPGGKRNGRKERIEECARRELREETGATDFDIVSICTYGIRKNKKGSSEYYGRLFYADIYELGELPDMEIGEVKFFDEIPTELTYPHIQPNILNKVNEYRQLNDLPTI